MFVWFKFCLLFIVVGLTVPFFATRHRPEVTLEQWSFLEKIFAIKLKKRKWAKLVTLDTIHWYCDGPEPTEATRHYDNQAHRRKSIILYFLLLFLVIYLTFSFHLP